MCALWLQAKPKPITLTFFIALHFARRTCVAPLYRAVVVQLYRPFTPPATVMITSLLLLLYN